MASTVFVDGVTLSYSAWAQDVDNVVYQFLSGVTGTNTITATGPAGLGAYAAGRKFRFIPAATNTGAVTINITGASALGARAIFSGGVALTGGELKIGVPCEIIDDGTQFDLSTPLSQSGLWTPSVGGTATYISRAGIYRALANGMFIAGQMSINAIGTGSTTVISGLPATSNASVGGGGVIVTSSTLLATAVVSIVGSIAAAGTSITFRSRVAANAADAVNAVFQNLAIIEFAGWYPT